ncbi:MAG: tetratricopeptide repeat protein [Pirellulales bacterium]
MSRTVAEWWSYVLLALSLLAVTLGRADPARADAATDQYAVAAEHYSQQRWDLAAAEFEVFLQRYADHPRAGHARFYLAEALVQAGQYARAHSEFRVLLRGSPEGPFARQAMFRAGESAFLAKDHTNALADLTAFHERYADDPLCRYVLPYLGEIALADGRADEARRWFDIALERFPDGPLHADCLLGLGRAAELRQAWSEAVDAYAKLASTSAEKPAEQGQFQLGLMQYRQDNYQQALAAWQAFEQRYPNSTLQPRVELGRGWILYRQGSFEEAEAKFAALVSDTHLGLDARYWLGTAQRAQRKWQDSAATLLAVGEAGATHRLAAAAGFYAADSLLAAGDHQRAVDQFEHVLATHLESDYADDALLGIARAAMAAGRFQQTLQRLDTFATQFPTSSLAGEAKRLRGSALVALDRHDDAVASLQDYIANSSGGADLDRGRAELAISQAKLGQMEDARATYADFLRTAPNQALRLATTHQLAEAAYAAGDRAWASELFRALTADGNPPEFVRQGLSGLAWSQLEVRDLEGSAETFHQLMANYPDDPLAAEAALVRGQIFERQKKYDPALALYHEVIDRHPDSVQAPRAMLAAARLHERLRQVQQSRELYGRLVEAFPDFANRDAALFGFAWSLRESGESQQASAVLRTLHEDIPGSQYWPSATYLLAQQASEANDHPQADELLAELIDKSPPPELLVKAHYLRGRVATAAERWDDATSAMLQAKQTAPDDPLALAAEFWIAEIAYRRGNYASAAELLDGMTSQAEGRNDAWLPMIPLRRAQVHAQLGEWTEAHRLATSILEESPQFEQDYEVHYLVGRCLAARADFAGAREAYARAIAAAEGVQTETAAMSQWMIGETYMHQQQYELAYREYLRCEILYEAYPAWRARSLLQAGKCAEQTGRWSDAVKLYERLIASFPETESAEPAQQRLAAARRQAQAAETSRE